MNLENLKSSMRQSTFENFTFDEEMKQKCAKTIKRGTST